MKKILLALAIAFIGKVTMGQDRYLDEVFTNDDLMIIKNYNYAINTNPLLNTSLMDPTYVMANAAQIQAEKDSLQGMIYTNPASIPLGFFYPYSMDSSSILKITVLKADIYMPDTAIDEVSERPVIVLVHTGNFLPPVINGSYGGSKEDSANVELAHRWARRGFVVVVPNYRHGWNPIATGSAGLPIRRATLLNAVYRAIHDIQFAVKTIRYSAAAWGNPFRVASDKIAMYGVGSGGYVALGYNTLDKQEETALPKFVFGGNSVIQPAIVGDVDGNGGLINLYMDNGMSDEVSICVNAGGALGDISWMESGDGPFVSFHAPYDNFAPFDTGTVIVPTTGDDVVDVNGPNTFIAKANSLGSNDVFAGFYGEDDFTIRARSFYGRAIENAPLININETMNIPEQNMEGLFSFIVRDDNTGDIEITSAPWEWWSKDDLDLLVAQTNAQTGGSYNSDDINANNMLTNPNMSKEQGMTYIDTIIGYMMPRVVKTLQIGNWQSVNVNDLYMGELDITLFPNPAIHQINIKTSNPGDKFTRVSILDMAGRTVYENIETTNFLQVDITKLNTGIYVSHISAESGELFVRKFIVE